jgi:hypothetical protein
LTESGGGDNDEFAGTGFEEWRSDDWQVIARTVESIAFWGKTGIRRDSA